MKACAYSGTSESEHTIVVINKKHREAAPTIIAPTPAGRPARLCLNVSLLELKEKEKA